MSQSYFCIGGTLSSLVNVETLVSLAPGTALIQGGSPMPLTGGVSRRLLSGRLKRSGSANAAWFYGFFDNDAVDLKAFKYSVLGDYLFTVSRQRYVITEDEHGDWSPFLVDIAAPYIGQSMNMHNGVPYDMRFDLTGGILQYTEETSSFTLAVSEHLVLVDASGGNVTATLPALSGVTADVPYRFVLTSASGDLILDGASSEQVDGNTTKTISGLNAGVTIIKSGSAWVSI